MNIGLCKSCGTAFDPAEIDDGYCLGCQPDSGEIEEPPAVDWDRVTGDCV
jgi:hypothetical protein